MYVLSLVMLVIDPSSTTTRNKQVHTEEDSNCSLKHPQRNKAFLVGDPTGLGVISIRNPLFAQLFHRFRLNSPKEEGAP